MARLTKTRRAVAVFIAAGALSIGLASPAGALEAPSTACGGFKWANFYTADRPVPASVAEMFDDCFK
jgi:hypothetical protein